LSSGFGTGFGTNGFQHLRPGFVGRNARQRFQLFQLQAVVPFQILGTFFVGFQLALQGLFQTLDFFLRPTHFFLLAVEIVLRFAQPVRCFGNLGIPLADFFFVGFFEFQEPFFGLEHFVPFDGFRFLGGLFHNAGAFPHSHALRQGITACTAGDQSNYNIHYYHGGNFD
jgi:hypothetical protein